MKGSTEDRIHNPILHFTLIISHFLINGCFLCYVLVYKWCLITSSVFLQTIAIWGAFFTSSDVLVVLDIKGKHNLFTIYTLYKYLPTREQTLTVLKFRKQRIVKFLLQTHPQKCHYKKYYTHKKQIHYLTVIQIT